MFGFVALIMWNKLREMQFVALFRDFGWQTSTFNDNLSSVQASVSINFNRARANSCELKLHVNATILLEDLFLSAMEDAGLQPTHT